MHVYFSGIGGVGIASLAELADDHGYRIEGSDLSPSLSSAQLQRRGVRIRYAQDAPGLRQRHAEDPIDWFVHTAALRTDHPELSAAQELGIPTAKRDELLLRIVQERGLKLIALSGSHGKTTSTGMVIWAFQQLGIPLSWSIGTTLGFGASGSYQPGSEYFAYECDEFDRNLLHFHPELAVISALGYDHPDTYPTPASYREAFRQFAVQSQRVYGWQDQQGEVFADLQQVELLPAETPLDRFTLAGHHNRRNAALVHAALAPILGREDALVAALNDFPGTDRRFERLAENLYSDYGHHPVEIAATLQMARELSERVVLVYQPHQNIRQHEILGQYTDQFELAEQVFWLPTYLSREDPALRILPPEELIASVYDPDNIEIATWGEALWQRLQDYRRSGALVLAMGAGTIDALVRERLAAGG